MHVSFRLCCSSMKQVLHAYMSNLSCSRWLPESSHWTATRLWDFPGLVLALRRASSHLHATPMFELSCSSFEQCVWEWCHVGCPQVSTMTPMMHCSPTGYNSMEIKRSADRALALLDRVVPTKDCYKDNHHQAIPVQYQYCPPAARWVGNLNTLQSM